MSFCGKISSKSRSTWVLDKSIKSMPTSSPSTFSASCSATKFSVTALVSKSPDISRNWRSWASLIRPAFNSIWPASIVFQLFVISCPGIMSSAHLVIEFQAASRIGSKRIRPSGWCATNLPIANPFKLRAVLPCPMLGGSWLMLCGPLCMAHWFTACNVLTWPSPAHTQA